MGNTCVWRISFYVTITFFSRYFSLFRSRLTGVSVNLVILSIPYSFYYVVSSSVPSLSCKEINSIFLLCKRRRDQFLGFVSIPMSVSIPVKLICHSSYDWQKQLRKCLFRKGIWFQFSIADYFLDNLHTKLSRLFDFCVRITF